MTSNEDKPRCATSLSLLTPPFSHSALYNGRHDPRRLLQMTAWQVVPPVEQARVCSKREKIKPTDATMPTASKHVSRYRHEKTLLLGDSVRRVGDCQHDAIGFHENSGVVVYTLKRIQIVQSRVSIPSDTKVKRSFVCVRVLGHSRSPPLPWHSQPHRDVGHLRTLSPSPRRAFEYSTPRYQYGVRDYYSTVNMQAIGTRLMFCCRMQHL